MVKFDGLDAMYDLWIKEKTLLSLHHARSLITEYDTEQPFVQVSSEPALIARVMG